ncbi:MAG: hypothetical protein FJ087_04965 [Deltaproteobacteria bacterium]|nr:hypothetical protein [Deltaproteobacteria bacterium]
MPFDWMHDKVNPAFAKKIVGRFAEMHRAEMEQRARLLHNLKYTRDRAIARLRQNLEWDFEMSRVPKFRSEIPGIVDRVYRRAGK